jgi:hypothetical protein
MGPLDRLSSDAGMPFGVEFIAAPTPHDLGQQLGVARDLTRYEYG